MAMRELEIRPNQVEVTPVDERYNTFQFSRIAQTLDKTTHNHLFRNKKLGLISMTRVARVMNAAEELAMEGILPSAADLALATGMTEKQAAAHLYVSNVLYGEEILNTRENIQRLPNNRPSKNKNVTPRVWMDRTAEGRITAAVQDKFNGGGASQCETVVFQDTTPVVQKPTTNRHKLPQVEAADPGLLRAFKEM